MSHAPSRYQIVQRRPSRRRWIVAVVGTVWLLSLGLAWHWAGVRAAPTLAAVSQRMHDAEQRLASQQSRLRELSQRETTLIRSEQISRDANADLQGTLAERDEEIAALRADVAFYERFVGATAQRRGLSVHELRLQPQTDQAWHFTATLTQNLNRGAVNAGRLQISVEGTRDGKLQRLDWSELRQEAGEPGVAYSFKYFQQIEGDLVLPADFKPVRVVARLVPQSGAAVEQSFTWAAVSASQGAAGA